MEFLETKYLYILLLGFSLLYPLAQSFEHRLQLFKKWKFIFPAMLIMAAIFIPWDIWFTHQGVWWFNEKYITGIPIFNLPLEECLFFFIIPYCCVFLYEVLNYYVKKNILGPFARTLTIVYMVTLGIALIFYHSQIYTLVTFVLTIFTCFYLILKKPLWLGPFWLMYIVSWLPFMLINGALTGSWTQEVLVNYNPQEIIGWRVGTIPIEDSVYSFLMLSWVIAIYEFLNHRNLHQ